MSRFIERAWYGHTWLTWLLTPLSWVFRGVAGLRRRSLKRQAHAECLAVPVVVVGNISVGGTGKTPLLIALVKKLAAAGYRPGVISRGYGGRAGTYPQRVTVDTAASIAGDEPVLIAAQTGVPVVVDPNRLRAARYLLEQTSCNVIFSDDGLQHYRLPRDIEIVVVDGRRGFGNGRLLPAGPLREPLQRLQSVDYVVINGGEPLPGVAPSYSMSLQPQKVLLHLQTGKPLALNDWKLSTRSVHAVAGIGNPQRFADTLLSLGFEVELHPFPDHHDFRAADIHFDDGKAVFMTAKDAVKCRAIAGPDCWVLDVEAQVPAVMLESLVAKIKALSTPDPDATG